MEDLEKLVRDYLVGTITLDDLYQRRFQYVDACDDRLFSAIESTLTRFDFADVPKEIVIPDERALRYELIEALVVFHRESLTYSSGTTGTTDQNGAMSYTVTRFRSLAYRGPAQAS